MKSTTSQSKKETDSKLVAESIELLADQIKQVLESAHLIKIPKEYACVNRVVINGMGGSNLGAGVVKAVFADTIKVPVEITPGYQVPATVDKNTLYILSSYSGATEEPLSVYKEVKKRGAKIIAITAGGRLKDLMYKENIPGYVFTPELNPSGQPRLGLGYSIFGMLVLMAKAGLFAIRPADIREIIDFLELNDRKYRPRVGQKINQAKKFALKIKDRQPVIVGAEFLAGNLRVLRNQFCETAKNFAGYLELPDLNHFAMEGLRFPDGNKNNLIFVFFESDFYSRPIQLRNELTKKVVAKNDIKILSVKLGGRNKLEQSLEFLQLGTWITYYLGMLNGVNPNIVPFVDWFKKELAKRK